MWVAVQEWPHHGERRYNVWSLFTARHQSRPAVLVLRGGEIRADALFLERLLPFAAQSATVLSRSSLRSLSVAQSSATLFLRFDHSRRAIRRCILMAVSKTLNYANVSY